MVKKQKRKIPSKYRLQRHFIFGWNAFCSFERYLQTKKSKRGKEKVVMEENARMVVRKRKSNFFDKAYVLGFETAYKYFVKTKKIESIQVKVLKQHLDGTGRWRLSQQDEAIRRFNSLVWDKNKLTDIQKVLGSK